MKSSSLSASARHSLANGQSRLHSIPYSNGREMRSVERKQSWFSQRSIQFRYWLATGCRRNFMLSRRTEFDRTKNGQSLPSVDRKHAWPLPSLTAGFTLCCSAYYKEGINAT